MGIVLLFLLAVTLSSAILSALLSFLLKSTRDWKYFTPFWVILFALILWWGFAGIRFFAQSPSLNGHSPENGFASMEWIFFRLPVLAICFVPTIPCFIITVLNIPLYRNSKPSEKRPQSDD
jgi:hypothetical protein